MNEFKKGDLVVFNNLIKGTNFSLHTSNLQMQVTSGNVHSDLVKVKIVNGAIRDMQNRATHSSTHNSGIRINKRYIELQYRPYDIFDYQ